MNNITGVFEEIYIPKKALVIFHSLKEQERNVYVEAYDMDDNGQPSNAHPLSISECTEMAEVLNSSRELKRQFLKPIGLLPEKILYINPDIDGFAIWYTPKQFVNLFFAKDLGLPCGKAYVPALIWKASKDVLSIFAVQDEKKPTEKTKLYHAPFFNIYETGKVCMGTVDIEINPKSTLEEFIYNWEQYFWNSYFSHLLNSHCPVNTNIIQLWQEQLKNKTDFPLNILIKNGRTIKDLLYGHIT